MENENTILKLLRDLAEQNIGVIIEHSMDLLKNEDDPTIKKCLADLGLAKVELGICCTLYENLKERIAKLDKECKMLDKRKF